MNLKKTKDTDCYLCQFYIVNIFNTSGVLYFIYYIFDVIAEQSKF